MHSTLDGFIVYLNCVATVYSFMMALILFINHNISIHVTQEDPKY